MAEEFDFHPLAREELKERLAYQQAHYPQLAEQWLNTVKREIAAIVEDPLRHREREREYGHRRVNLGRFPHYLAYVVENDRPVFIAVGSGSQDHLYWKSRVRVGS